MIDLIQSLRGPKHCSWCSLKPYNWIDRRFGGFDNEVNLFDKFVWWIYTHGGLGIWRVGRWWHFKNHVIKVGDYYHSKKIKIRDI